MLVMAYPGFEYLKYIPINYDDYKDINDLPIRDDIIDHIPIDKLPEFASRLMFATFPSREGKCKFFYKFIIYYLTDAKFREITDKYSFSFVGGDYIGAYKNSDIATREGFRIKKTRPDAGIFICFVRIPIWGTE